MIKRVNSWTYDYKPSASEECKRLLYILGIKYCNIKSTSGSHSVDIWIGSKDEVLFKNEILENTFVGTYRAFYFGKSYNMFGEFDGYCVSYLNKDKYNKINKND